MWLSTAASMGCVLLPSHVLRRLAITAVIGITAASSLLIIYGNQVFSNLDFLTYNENYSVADTMEDRQNQLLDALKLIELQGKGLGAEVEIYKVGTNEVDRLHHVHSLYLFQFLQLGIVSASLCFAYLAALPLILNELSTDRQRHDWRIPAAVASIVGLTLNGVTLVSMHSAFAGIAFGLAFAAHGERWSTFVYHHPDTQTHQ